MSFSTVSALVNKLLYNYKKTFYGPLTWYLYIPILAVNFCSSTTKQMVTDAPVPGPLSVVLCSQLQALQFVNTNRVSRRLDGPMWLTHDVRDTTLPLECLANAFKFQWSPNNWCPVDYDNKVSLLKNSCLCFNKLDVLIIYWGAIL